MTRTAGGGNSSTLTVIAQPQYGSGGFTLIATQSSGHDLSFDTGQSWRPGFVPPRSLAHFTRTESASSNTLFIDGSGTREDWSNSFRELTGTPTVDPPQIDPPDNDPPDDGEGSGESDEDQADAGPELSDAWDHSGGWSFTPAPYDDGYGNVTTSEPTGESWADSGSGDITGEQAESTISGQAVDSHPAPDWAGWLYQQIVGAHGASWRVPHALQPLLAALSRAAWNPHFLPIGRFRAPTTGPAHFAEATFAADRARYEAGRKVPILLAGGNNGVLQSAALAATHIPPKPPQLAGVKAVFLGGGGRWAIFDDEGRLVGVFVRSEGYVYRVTPGEGSNQRRALPIGDVIQEIYRGRITGQTGWDGLFGSRGFRTSTLADPLAITRPPVNGQGYGTAEERAQALLDSPLHRHRAAAMAMAGPAVVAFLRHVGVELAKEIGLNLAGAKLVSVAAGAGGAS